MKRCVNKRCGDAVDFGLLCPACRLIGRQAFAFGAFVVGVAWGLWEALK
jgi:hypothetical protein